MVRRTTSLEDNNGKEPNTTTFEDMLSTASLVTPSSDIHHDLDPEGAVNNVVGVNGSAMQALSIDERYRLERQTAKVRHWRENQYAVGMVEVSWKDELSRHLSGEDDDDDVNGPNRECCADLTSDTTDPTCGCLIASGYACSKLGAGRVGNMAVLKERVVMEKDDQGVSVRTTKIEYIVGPYWPMMVFITYPLILGVSFWTAYSAIPHVPFLFASLWAFLTFGLCYSLFSVAFRDPGILPRFANPPTEEEINKFGYKPKYPYGRNSSPSSQDWRWNDQALTYRPRGAVFDPDCAVVVEDFDHTCPWTGTAIGKKNMPAFQSFIGFLFTCLIMDVLLLTGAIGQTR